MYQNR